MLHVQLAADTYTRRARRAHAHDENGRIRAARHRDGAVPALDALLHAPDAIRVCQRVDAAVPGRRLL